jgi:hypothetical protein
MLITKRDQPLPPTAEDLLGFVAMKDIAKQVGSGLSIDYWKSVPYFANFMDGYQLSHKFRNYEFDPLTRRRLLANAQIIRRADLTETITGMFEAAGDDLALYLAYLALAELESQRARMDAALEACDRAFAHAERASHLPAGILGSRAAFRFFGTTPVPELLAWLDENEPRAGRDQFLRAYRAGALGMLGRFDEARAILAGSRAEQAERGGGILLANLTAFECVDLELWAGDPAAAAEFGAEGFALHEELGDPGFMSSAAASYARALYALDLLDDAEAWAGRAAELGASDDARKEMLWRRISAKVLARRGEHAEAERLAREAVAICDGTEMLDAQGDVYADTAEVLLLAGRREEAAEAFGQAIARYERKGNLVMSARTRPRLEELRETAP